MGLVLVPRGETGVRGGEFVGRFFKGFPPFRSSLTSGIIISSSIGAGYFLGGGING